MFHATDDIGLRRFTGSAAFAYNGNPRKKFQRIFRFIETEPFSRGPNPPDGFLPE
jgi:hypothetical protein